MDITIHSRLVSSLEKVFPGKQPEELKTPVTLLQNDFTAYQIAVRPDCESIRILGEADVESPIADCITIRQVEQVPVRLAAPSVRDGDWLSGEAGMYPDLLQPPCQNGQYVLYDHQWNSFWIGIETKKDTPAGTWPVTIRIRLILLPIDDPDFREITVAVTVPVTVIGAVLPKQTLRHTEWFHADCVAEHYHVQPFSEEHWKLVEEQVLLAARRGINMLLTPLFTYPLDTEYPAERTITQLVDVTYKNGEYIFGFDKFRRWVDMAKRCGIEYFEMSHLFSQGGPVYAVKVMAETEEGYRRLFDRNEPSDGEAYLTFLSKLLPELTAVIDELGIHEKTVFHISDEPPLRWLSVYDKLKQWLQPYIGSFTVIDALSDYDFYRDGVCTHPVVSTDCITPFLEGETPEDFWIYYCVGNFEKVANRFIAMPSYRNRILAEQLYKYDVDGFLHWGYNFYNTTGSFRRIDPFASTDSGGTFPAGDPFLVYPGEDGKPWPSIRLEVLWEALCDLRAFKLLESLTAKEYVMSLIEADGEVTFFDYPRNADHILKLRQKVNEEIAKHI